MKYDQALNVVPFFSFFSTVTDGLQSNAEESGTGCRGLLITLYADTQTHALSIKHDQLPQAFPNYSKFINSISSMRNIIFQCIELSKLIIDQVLAASLSLSIYIYIYIAFEITAVKAKSFFQYSFKLSVWKGFHLMRWHLFRINSCCLSRRLPIS